jgi:hypothetical protein
MCVRRHVNGNASVAGAASANVCRPCLTSEDQLNYFRSHLTSRVASEGYGGYFAMFLGMKGK